MDMKRDYYEDVQLFSSGVVAFWFCILIVFLAAFPFLAKNYYVYVANYMAINVIVVVGLNLLVGYTGQISMGHAGFFAIGAYATIVLMTKAHFPFLLALPCGGLVAALFGFLLGLPALRLEGPYLAIATLGFGITVTQIIGKIKMFGERQGLHAPELTIGPWHIETDKDFYFVLIPITIFLVVIARNIVKTKVGRAFISIRDADIAAETMGVNLTFYKTTGLCRQRILCRCRRRSLRLCAAIYRARAFQFVHVGHVPDHGGGRRPGIHDGTGCRSLPARSSRPAAQKYSRNTLHRAVDKSPVGKLFYHDRGIQHPVDHIRPDPDFNHALRAPGDIRDMDTHQEILEDVAVLKYIAIGTVSDNRDSMLWL